MKNKKHIDLALQGGGAHGAFTWGIIEELLLDERIEISGACGTSAGAMNATMLTYGLHIGGRQGAIDMLNKFWKKTSDNNKYSLLQPSILDKIEGMGGMEYSPFYKIFEAMSQMASPYQFNPLDLNPLKDILVSLIDFDELKKCTRTKLYLCATNVRTSRVKVFSTKEIDVEMVLASACLPFMFKAVTIDGEDYWDGGYMGNPPIFPLIDGTESEDILLAQINPIQIKTTPKTVDAIRDRVNELSFNSSLMHEMSKIHLIQKLLDKGIDLTSVLGPVKKLNIHAINAETEMADMNVSSKLNTDWEHLNNLKQLGKEKAKIWLQNHYNDIGNRSSCDVEKVFI